MIPFMCLSREDETKGLEDRSVVPGVRGGVTTKGQRENLGVMDLFYILIGGDVTLCVYQNSQT